jgi:hypothetical protein
MPGSFCTPRTQIFARRGEHRHTRMGAVQFPAPIGAASDIKLGYGKLDQMRRAEMLDFSRLRRGPAGE